MCHRSSLRSARQISTKPLLRLPDVVLLLMGYDRRRGGRAGGRGEGGTADLWFVVTNRQSAAVIENVKRSEFNICALV